MDSQALDKIEKLGKLKDKGIITQDEYEAKKYELLNPELFPQHTDGSTNKDVGYGTGIIVCIIIGVLFISVLSMVNSNINFACDETTMRKAEKLINRTYKNLNNSLRLYNTVPVKESENYLKCKAETNYTRDLPYIHYELDRQPDGDILIRVNPYEDVFEQEWKKLWK